MTEAAPRPETYSASDIDAILRDLNAQAPSGEQLARWANEAGVPVRRAVATPELTYVRLAGKDETGGPIVLMLLDAEWERAI